MAKIRIELTMEELQALLTLASNQFFRMKYIDPKLPGHKERPDELRAAQSAVQVLETALKAKKGFKAIPSESPGKRPQAIVQVTSGRYGNGGGRSG